MQKSRFYLVKYLSILVMLLLYFFIIYYLLKQWKLLEVLLKQPDRIRRCNCIFSFLYCVLYALLLRSFEGFMIGHRRILDLSFGHFIASVFMNGLFMLMLWSLGCMDMIDACGCFVFMVTLECACGLLWILLLHRSYERFHFRKGALFIYGKRENPKEYHHMKSTLSRYFKVNREIDFRVGREMLLQEVDKAGIVFLGDIPVQLRNELLKLCMQTQKECYCMPKISDVYIQSAAVRQLHDKLLLQFPVIGISGSKKYAKRAMDVLVSLVLLLLLLPVMVVIAIAIKLEDGGCIFYRQERVTEGNRDFYMLKFRSMREEAEKDGMTLARQQDDRVTAVGHVIRNLHFDELPQLLNVLKGDMSLVGPRPERRQFIEEYAAIIPEFSERLKVRGGLTGYAQVYGKYNTEPEDKIKYDLYYIYNYSLWLDVKILVLTIRILFQPEHTQGITQEQTSAVKKRE